MRLSGSHRWATRRPVELFGYSPDCAAREFTEPPISRDRTTSTVGPHLLAKPYGLWSGGKAAEKGGNSMRKSLALFGAVSTAVVLLSVSAGTAAAGPQPGGCPAFGAFMGASASWSGQNQRPLGQLVRQLTPFNEALAVYKTGLCGQ
jgi:hypothetical protein